MNLKQLYLCLILGSLLCLQGCSPILKVISAHFAKEFCSCYYVVGQSQNYCESYVDEYIPVSGYEILESTKEIIARGLGQESAARFISQKFGCRLVR
jgi:hypothetical protein